MLIKRNIILLSALVGITFFSSFLLQTGGELAKSMKRGEEIYNTNCIACHQANGEGLPGAFPPLAKSDFLMADTHRSIKIIKEGFQGEMTVNGQPYYGVMPANNLDGEQLADIMNYIRNSWGNKGEIVKIQDVNTALQK